MLERLSQLDATLVVDFVVRHVYMLQTQIFVVPKAINQLRDAIRRNVVALNAQTLESVIHL